jgi:hypothetical protein
MEPKPRSLAAKAGAYARPTVVKRAKGNAETARMFLDVDEVIRRAKTQPLSLSRYVE